MGSLINQSNMYIGSLNFIRFLRVVSSRFFESEPNDIYSRVSEKGSKGRFFAPKTSRITISREKERRKRKS